MGKSFDQFRHFDEAAYREEILPLAPAELTALHGRISRKLVGASMGTAHGVVCAPFTGGVSLVATGVNGRRTNVNHRRLKVIEVRLLEINAEKSKLRKRDFAIPAGVLSLSMGMAHGVEGLFAEHLATETAVHVAGTSAEMVQEPVYMKMSEKLWNKHEKPPNGPGMVPTSSGAMPSVPSPMFAVPSPGVAQPGLGASTLLAPVPLRPAPVPVASGSNLTPVWAPQPALQAESGLQANAQPASNLFPPPPALPQRPLSAMGMSSNGPAPVWIPQPVVVTQSESTLTPVEPTIAPTIVSPPSRPASVIGFERLPSPTDSVATLPAYSPSWMPSSGAVVPNGTSFVPDLKVQPAGSTHYPAPPSSQLLSETTMTSLSLQAAKLRLDELSNNTVTTPPGVPQITVASPLPATEKLSSPPQSQPFEAAGPYFPPPPTYQAATSNVTSPPLAQDTKEAIASITVGSYQHRQSFMGSQASPQFTGYSQRPSVVSYGQDIKQPMAAFPPPPTTAYPQQPIMVQAGNYQPAQWSQDIKQPIVTSPQPNHQSQSESGPGAYFIPAYNPANYAT